MITPDQISSQIGNYLDHAIDGTELVNCVDAAVSTDSVYDYDDNVQIIILKYQDILANYVGDPVKRSESSSFYGPDKLRAIATDFKKELDALI